MNASLTARLSYLRRLISIQTPSYSTKKAPQRSQKTAAVKKEDFVFEDLNNRIAKFKRELVKNKSLASLRARELSTSISNLSQSIVAVKAKQNALNMDIPNIPARVSIEILSNGTGQLEPTIALRTQLKTYLFNCPESTSRFLPNLGLKTNNINDIFITRGVWNNIGGISGLLLGKDASSSTTRIHGALSIKSFLECIRPFHDSDFGSAKYPSQIEECAYTVGGFEDAALKVTYIPLSAPLHVDSDRKGCTIDVAYLIELKPLPPRIDIKKIMAKGVPVGPMIGLLKKGEQVKLENGTIVRPEDVCADEPAGGAAEKATLLVAECQDSFCVEALAKSSVLEPFINKQQVLHYFVHFSPAHVVNSAQYRKLCEQIGNANECEHIIANGSGPSFPHSEGIFRHQRMQRKFAPNVFPELFPPFYGLLSQNNEHCRYEAPFSMVAPFQRFYMRQSSPEEPYLIDLRDLPTEDETTSNDAHTDEEKDAFEKLCSEFNDASSSVLKSSPQEYPCISFLGTSSATPTKYRNVTGYLVETSASSSFLVDAGEGTYGQLRVLFGEERSLEVLIGLNAIFITHAHQDHIGGIFTIIEKRRDAFNELKKPFKKLVLVCNGNVVKPLRKYSQSFMDLTALYEEVNLSTVMTISPPRQKRSNASPPRLSAVQSILPLISAELFDAAEWGLESALAVQVHHTRMANGFVFTALGKKIVFSGDTKPCNLLVEQGKDADLLIHECTFEDGFERDAERKKHSTMGQAVDVARRMAARTTILTHFSARYHKVPPLPEYLDAAGDIAVAMDNLRARCDHWTLLPRLIQIYRYLFHARLFELGIRKEQRNTRNEFLKSQSAAC